MRLLDSNILIYAGQPEHAFLDSWISSASAQVSAISIPEVLGYPGLSAEDEAIFEEWFAELIVHLFPKMQYARLRNSALPTS